MESWRHSPYQSRRGTMICTHSAHPEFERLAAFVAGELTERDSLEIEAHLSNCDNCRLVLEKLPSNDLELLLKRTPPFVVSLGSSGEPSYATRPPSEILAGVSPTWR